MHFVIHSIVAAAPVVDLDGTLWVQGGLFLLMVVVLKPLLFDPWIATQERRVQAIDGSLEKAASLRTEADKLGSDYDARLDEARDRALRLRSQARREEETNQSQSLARVREQANTELEQQRQRLSQQASEARTELGNRVDELARQITTKLLGRTP